MNVSPNELLDAIPTMDYSRYTCPAISSSVTAVAVAAKLIVIGTSDGLVHVLSDKGEPIPVPSRLDRFGSIPLPVSQISIDESSTCFGYISGASIGLIEDVGSQKVHGSLIPVDRDFLPAVDLALCPKYSQGDVHRRIVLAGGKTSDLLVLSQQGHPFPSKSVSKGGDSVGPVTGVSWRGDYLLWWGPQFGLKLMNACTGQKVTQLSIRGNIKCFFDSGTHLIVALAGLEVTVAQIVKQTSTGNEKCEVLFRVKLDPMAFIPPLSKWNDVLVEDSSKLRILGIGPFDKDSLVLMSSRGHQLVHSVLDCRKQDLPFNDVIAEHVNDAVFCPGSTSLFSAVVANNKEVIKVRIRTLWDHCEWLLNVGLVDAALELAIRNRGGDPDLARHVIDCAVPALMEKQEFPKVVSLVPQMSLDSASKWSAMIDRFISIQTGAILADSLRCLLTIVPFPPRDEILLDYGDYRKIIDTLVRNHEFSAVQLMETVSKWPTELYDSRKLVDRLVDAIPEDFSLDPSESRRMFPRGVNSFDGKSSLAHAHAVALLLTLIPLYDSLGTLTDKLDILLRLRCIDDLFDCMNRNPGMVGAWFEINMHYLFMTEPTKTSSFVVRNSILFPPSEVCKQLSDHPYLKHVFLKSVCESMSPAAVKPWQDDMVQLYMQFEQPQKLSQFLVDASDYSVSHALILVQKDANRNTLVQAEAVLLWKSGHNKEAIDLLLKTARDVGTAVALASRVNDQKLSDTILSAVRKDEQGLICGYLRSVASPEEVLLSISHEGVKADGLLTVARSIIHTLGQAKQIRGLNRDLIKHDVDSARRVKDSGSNCLKVNPESEKCRICGALVCVPVPSVGTDRNVPLQSIMNGPRPIFTTAKAALVVINASHGGPVHGSCLLKVGGAHD